MKQLVQLSTISRQWRYRWLSIPCLNFDHKMWVKRTKRRLDTNLVFMNFVDHVLRLNSNFNVARFFVSCESSCDVNRIHNWIFPAANRHAREFNIYFTPEKYHKFPDCLFTSELEQFTFKSSKDFYCNYLPDTMHSSLDHLKTPNITSACLRYD